jgi:hypothetical protein
MKKLQAEVTRLKVDMKKVKDVLEMSDNIDILHWPELGDLDRKILLSLLNSGSKGLTSTEIASQIKIPDPATSGRVKVWHRIKRIRKIGHQKKGGWVIVQDFRRWVMNTDDFTFIWKERHPGGAVEYTRKGVDVPE